MRNEAKHGRELAVSHFRLCCLWVLLTRPTTRIPHVSVRAGGGAGGGSTVVSEVRSPTPAQPQLLKIVVRCEM